MTSEQQDAIERAREILNVTVQFIRHNPIANYQVFYDIERRDGARLALDCKNAIWQLNHAFQEAPHVG